MLTKEELDGKYLENLTEEESKKVQEYAFKLGYTWMNNTKIIHPSFKNIRFNIANNRLFTSINIKDIKIQVSDIFDEPNFIVGKWYKTNVDKGYYCKILKHKNNELWASEQIRIDKGVYAKCPDLCFDGNPNYHTYTILKSLEEIQQYLPEGHVDLIKKEFVLPEKWKLYILNDDIRDFITSVKLTHMSCESWLISDLSLKNKYNSWKSVDNSNYTEITLDQFKQYVLKEPKKLTIDDVVEGNFYNLLDYAIFEAGRLGYIGDNGKDWRPDCDNDWGRLDAVIPATQTETKWVNTCRKQDKFIPEDQLDLYDDITFELKTKTIEKWSVGSYLVCKSNTAISNNCKIGDVKQIIEFDTPHVKFQGESRFGKGSVFAKDFKWFPTLQEAEEFSKSLIVEDKSSETTEIECETCNGTGEVMVGKLYPNGHTEVNEECPDCNGEGIVEDKSIKMKEYVKCETQEQWDFVINKTEGSLKSSDFNLKVYPKIVIHINGKGYSGEDQYNLNNYITFQEWLDLNNYTFNEKEEYKVGDWVVITKQYNGNAAKKDNIVQFFKFRPSLEAKYEVSDNLNLYNWGYKESKCVNIRKATPKEIQKVTKVKEPNKEELLEEAKRRYPVGTKFKSEFNDNGKIREIKPYNKKDGITWFRDGKNIRSKDGLFTEDINGNTVCSNPLIYSNGKWAEIISLPETKDFDRNWYVKVNSQEEANQMFDYLERIGEKVGDNYSRKYSNTWKYIIYSKHEKQWLCNGIYDNTIERLLSDFIKPTIKTGSGLLDIGINKSEFKTLPITGQFEWEILNKPNPDHNYQSTTTLKQEPIKLVSFDDDTVLFKSAKIKTSNKQLIINN